MLENVSLGTKNIDIFQFMDQLPLQERQYDVVQQDNASCHSQLNVIEYIEHMFNGLLDHLA